MRTCLLRCLLKGELRHSDTQNTFSLHFWCSSGCLGDALHGGWIGWMLKHKSLRKGLTAVWWAQRRTRSGRVSLLHGAWVCTRLHFKLFVQLPNSSICNIQSVMQFPLFVVKTWMPVCQLRAFQIHWKFGNVTSHMELLNMFQVLEEASSSPNIITIIHHPSQADLALQEQSIPGAPPLSQLGFWTSTGSRIAVW